MRVGDEEKVLDDERVAEVEGELVIDVVRDKLPVREEDETAVSVSETVSELDRETVPDRVVSCVRVLEIVGERVSDCSAEAESVFESVSSDVSVRLREPVRSAVAV